MIKTTKKQQKELKNEKYELTKTKGEWLKNANTKPKTRSTQSRVPGELHSSFIKKISKMPRLSEKEEHDLGVEIRDFGNKESAKKLVLHNIKLAIKMAYQNRRSWTTLMDLVQEASYGMSIAAKKWNPEKGTRFGTYACYWIRAQLTKFLMTNSRLIHTASTRAGRKIYFSLPKIRRQLMAKNIEPTVELIAKEVKEDPREVERILIRLESKEASLSSYSDENSYTTLQDLIPGPEKNPEHQTAKAQTQEIIKKIIAGFEKTIKNQRDLIVWRDHLISHDPINLVELGKKYNVSKQRIGQLATRLKKSFKCHLIEKLSPDAKISWLFDED